MGIPLMIIGLIGVIWFFLPVPVAGFNIGNVTGLIVFGLILVYGILFHRVNRVFGRLWKVPPGKALLIVLSAAVAVICILVVAGTVCMIRGAVTKPQEKAAVVVLGCQVKTTKNGVVPGRMLKARLDRARQYLDAHPESVCIVSGGRGEDEDDEEADVMYAYLVGKGVNAARIYREKGSDSTQSNLMNTKELMDRENLGTSAAIVTDGFHEYRALTYAGRAGLSAGAVPVRTTLWLFPTYYVRELYGILYLWLGLGG